MSAIDDVFANLRRQGKKAFIPFVTAGDPDLDFTAEAIKLLAAHGAGICEIGIPYSDPIADGPVIQASYTRALAKKITLAEILKMVRGVSKQVATPLVSMVSYAIVYRHGLARFVADAKAAGLAGVIVADLLVEESGELSEICRRQDFSLIQLVTPTTPRQRAVKIAQAATGFVYYVSVTGITGERAKLPQELLDSVSWLRSQTKTPVCIGFGISQSEHVKLLAPAADGVIVGSAIVRRIAEAATRPREEVLAEVGSYVDGLVGAMG
ncbi:MAG: tryptophan synthase subunit alpha [Planctomycetia bacterium]|nr:tryptophan synthase subunit alpha [Planctomycetia bacterium]